MTAADTSDIWTRGAQWLPILAFHAGLCRQDLEAGFAVLQAGNPLYDAVPVDVLAAFFIFVDLVCEVGDVSADDLEALLRQWGDSLQDPINQGKGEPS